ncbi:MAG: PD40 domain-containing protein, partial [Gemmatimonadetes bacterium]|nr:PD40 domain-containing protein [Gemmatimonadota bacterium]
MFNLLQWAAQDLPRWEAKPQAPAIPTALPILLLTSVALVVSGIETGRAQETTSTDSIPSVQPRFEQLFWSDSLLLGGEIPAVRSFSPDGRWIAFSSFEDADRTNLWLVPLDGGDAVRLTKGRYHDDVPQWFRSGDAIAFRSTRPSGPSQDALYIMRLSLSPEDGRPLGPPRQVSLEPAREGVLSPDDQFIAYVAQGEDRTESLRVVPATGGAARTVITLPRIRELRWGHEGRFLYFFSRTDTLRSVMRVPVEGGEPQTLSTWDRLVRLGPEARYAYREVASQKGETAFEVTTIDGQALARFSLPESFVLNGFADSPNRFLATRQDLANPLRILPVAGGPLRHLKEGLGYDVPLGWASGGEDVFFSTELNGERIFMLAPVDGGTMRQVPIPEPPGPHDWPTISESGTQVLFLTAGEEPGSRGLSVYDTQSDNAMSIAEDIHFPPGGIGGRWDIGGRGGSNFRDRGEFLFGQTREGGHELWGTRPDGNSRLLWTFAAEEDPPMVAVAGERIAFTRDEGPDGVVFLAQVGDTQAQILFSRPGRMAQQGTGGLSWSPDGRRLTVAYTEPGGSEVDVLLVEFSETGEMMSEPRLLALDGGPKWWWSLQWMPDGEHFLVNGMGAEAVSDTQVWLVSVDPVTPPVALTADMKESVWDFTLSPDGRFIAIESQIPGGSSVWRIDLGDIVSGEAQG